jgi:hypothetical protein
VPPIDDMHYLVPPAPASMPVPPAPPAPPLPPEPLSAFPYPPVPPMPPDAPLPPPPPFGEGKIGQNERSRGNFNWSDGKDRLEIRYEGVIEFTDDDKDVKSISPDGLLRIRDGGVTGGRTVEFRSDSSGNVSRRYWEGSSERPFEPEGRRWLTEALPRFIRKTGIGASRRVARILAAKGPSGVLAEISEIEGSWAKRIYFAELLKSAKLDAATVRQILAQAGKEIDSDFELASLLTGASDRLLLDDSTRQAYYDAAKSIGSDFEMGRVYAAALKQGAVSPQLMASLLEASTAIGSDFEHARLLLQAVQLQSIEGPVRAPFFKAVGAIESSFERGRVLQAVAKRSDLSAETVLAVLRSAQMMGSNFETGRVLQAVAANHEISGEARSAYVDAASRLGDFEEGKALTALIKSERRK